MYACQNQSCFTRQLSSIKKFMTRSLAKSGENVKGIKHVNGRDL